jgi:hypothetical protein
MNDFIIENGILIKYVGNDRNIVIPDEVTVIGESAFYSCPTIITVKLHDKLTKIGDSAFSDCASLEKINIPDSVCYLGAYAFYDCTRLLSIELPESITDIGMETFSGCTRLTEVIFPKSITDIGQMAFAFCPLIEKVYYHGTEDDWDNIKFGQYNDYLAAANRYYYSETPPKNNCTYWHYNKYNLPEIWEISNLKIN